MVTSVKPLKVKYPGVKHPGVDTPAEFFKITDGLIFLADIQIS